MDVQQGDQDGRLWFARGFWPRFQRGDATAAMDVTKLAFLFLLVCVGIERLVELQLSRRHQRDLANCGARKHADPQYRWMVALHAAVLLGAALEVILLRRPFIALLAF